MNEHSDDDLLSMVERDLELRTDGVGKMAAESKRMLKFVNGLESNLISAGVSACQRSHLIAKFHNEYMEIRSREEKACSHSCGPMATLQRLHSWRKGPPQARSLKGFREIWDLRLKQPGIVPLPEHPQHPEHYRCHKSIFKDVVDYLRTGEKDVVILSGMFGMGKTLMAREIEVLFQLELVLVCTELRFPGGVHFVQFDRNVSEEGFQVEKKVDEQEQLRKLASSMKMHLADETDVWQALTDAARKKSCLIVLDDVWNSNSITRFRLPGHDGKLLVTSRRQKLWADAKVFLIGTSDIRDEKLDEHLLVARASSRGITHLPEEVKDRILKDCGGCLSLVAEIAESSNWDSLGNLREQIAVRELDSSVKALNAGACQLLAFLGLFNAGQRIPKEVIEHAWKVVNPSARLTEIALDTIVDFNFVTTHVEGTRVSYSLHPLVSHYLLNKKPSGWGEVDKLPILMREYANPVVMNVLAHWS